MKSLETGTSSSRILIWRPSGFDPGPSVGTFFSSTSTTRNSVPGRMSTSSSARPGFTPWRSRPVFETILVVEGGVEPLGDLRAHLLGLRLGRAPEGLGDEPAVIAELVGSTPRHREDLVRSPARAVPQIEIASQHQPFVLREAVGRRSRAHDAVLGARQLRRIAAPQRLVDVLVTEVREPDELQQLMGVQPLVLRPRELSLEELLGADEHPVAVVSALFRVPGGFGLVDRLLKARQLRRRALRFPEYPTWPDSGSFTCRASNAR